MFKIDKDLDNMTSDEKILLITHYGNYELKEVLEMTDEEIDDHISEMILEFEEEGLSEEIEKHADVLDFDIDIDDELPNLYQVLIAWDDYNDDSSMFPNGRDDDE